MSIIKRQFAARQLLLVNTAHCLKFLEEYLDRQAQIWKISTNITIFQMIYRIYIFILTISKPALKHLKKATLRNIQNIQTSFNLQRTYSSSLCLHVNNIYSKLLELQKQIQHHRMYMNQGDMVQIQGPKFDPDIDGDSPPSTD